MFVWVLVLLMWETEKSVKLYFIFPASRNMFHSCKYKFLQNKIYTCGYLQHNLFFSKKICSLVPLGCSDFGRTPCTRNAVYVYHYGLGSASGGTFMLGQMGSFMQSKQECFRSQCSCLCQVCARSLQGQMEGRLEGRNLKIVSSEIK